MSDQRFLADYTRVNMNMKDTFCSMTEVTTTTKRKKSKNKRRFNDDQIRSLESIFESESRLDPRKMYQVAKDLGLQPRQVAIWFQNKRARTKSKELERDYNILLHNYNNLASMLEGLHKEKQALASQLQKPKEEEQPSFSMERSEHAPGVLSDNDSAIIVVKT